VESLDGSVGSVALGPGCAGEDDETGDAATEPGDGRNQATSGDDEVGDQTLAGRLWRDVAGDSVENETSGELDRGREQDRA
jgi:hypothetical protein